MRAAQLLLFLVAGLSPARVPGAAPLATVPLAAAFQSHAPQLSHEAATRRWPNPEGGSARSGVVAGHPLRRQPERVWTHRVRGQIEDGPLIWNDLVVVSARETAGTRRLYFIDLETGRDLVPPLPVATRVPLAPTLWSHAVIVRRTDRELAAFQVGDRRGTPFWSWRSESPVGPPLAMGQDIYVTSEEGLVRLRIGQRDPLWILPGRFRGAVSGQEGQILAVRYDERGSALLTQIDRGSGEVRSEQPIGHHGGSVPPQGELPSIAIGSRTIIVHHSEPIVTENGEATAALLAHGGSLDAAPSGAVPLSGRAVDWNGGFVARFIDGQAEALVLRTGSGSTGHSVLATPESAASVLEDSGALARVGTVLYAGRSGIDLVDGRVLWELPHATPVRSVPAGAGLLAVVGGDALEAWVDPNARGPENELRRFETSLGAALANEYADLADRAKRAKDPQLLRRLAQSARAWGAPHSRTSALDQHVALLEKQRALAPDAKLSADIEAQAAALEHFVADGLWTRAHELATRRTDGDLRFLLLEEILRRAPNHPEATSWVAAELHHELRSIGQYAASEWLGFLRVTRRLPVNVHAARAPSGPVGEAFDEARAEWRRDLIGYESDRLLILTPPTTPPDAVARSLATGELVCSVLDDIFGAARPSRGPVNKLTLHLFSTKEEYTRVARNHVKDGAGLAWTAGHFDPNDLVSRIYFPGGEGGWDSVRQTYAHELTHHWLFERYFSGPLSLNPHISGFWIVEGFASFIEEFVFDIENGVWASENPRSHRLDVLSRSPETDRIEWAELFDISQIEFSDLEDDTRARVAPRWRLGKHSTMTERAFFYFQSAAVCRALFHADKGRHRDELIQYVENFYGGRLSNLGVENAFKMSATNLGRLTLDYARKRNKPQ